MRVVWNRLALTACFALCLPLSSPAQVHLQTYAGGQLAGTPNLPYTAVEKSTDFQTLADGNTITKTSETREARDSQGRTMHQRSLQFGAGADNPPRTMTDVFDLVTRTNLHWDSGSKQGVVFHMGQPSQVSSGTGGSARALQASNSRTPAPCQDLPGFEKLGTETIAGVSAAGVRRTRTIPEGKEGNSKPLTIMDETWTPPELHLMMRQVHDDPRTGRHTTEVTELERGEPDPALFQAPKGYTIRDQSPASQ